MNYGWTTAAPLRDNSSQPFKYQGFAPWRDSEAESWVSLSNKYARDHILIKSCEVTHSFGSHSFRSLHFIDVYEFVKSMMNMFRFAVPGSEGSFVQRVQRETKLFLWRPLIPSDTSGASARRTCPLLLPIQVGPNKEAAVKPLP